MRRLRAVRPKKIYLLADQGRDDEESALALDCRKAFEHEIDWDCEIVKHYATENRGVFNNIGLGALWVFERESKAIFLEDDNLPSISFFHYCSELLERYQNDESIFWICGTNYLGDIQHERVQSYYFTQSLLPCGWASWSDKFTCFYDAYFEKCKTKDGFKKIRKTYRNRALFRQQKISITNELLRYQKGMGFRSWDYQLISSLRANNLYGIVPACNQIRNIGVDALSEHGGSDYQDEMTRRFCSVEDYNLALPLIHPDEKGINELIEDRLDSIILQPLSYRIKSYLKSILLRF